MLRNIFGIITLIVALYMMWGPNPLTGKTPIAYAIRQDAELVTHAAALGLCGILRNVQDRGDQILMIRDFVRPARFYADESGYFFVLDFNGICIAHGAQTNMEGKAMLGAKDATGFKLFDRMIEIARDGGGFLEYTWTKPGKKGVFKKLAYVERIPGTDFLIGSGVYFPAAW